MLILTAGVLLMSRAFLLEGIEMTLASSHFGHLLSETLLLPTMLAIASQAGLSRIVLVTSSLLYWHGIFDLTKIVQVQAPAERVTFLAKDFASCTTQPRHQRPAQWPS